MDDLLRNAFTNEGLRRMARKAGVSSTREKDLILNDEVRVVAEIMLTNICEKIRIFADYHEKNDCERDYFARNPSELERAHGILLCAWR